MGYRVLMEQITGGQSDIFQTRVGKVNLGQTTNRFIVINPYYYYRGRNK